MNARLVIAVLAAAVLCAVFYLAFRDTSEPTAKTAAEDPAPLRSAATGEVRTPVIESPSLLPPIETETRLTGHVFSLETGEGVQDVTVMVEWSADDTLRDVDAVSDSTGAFTMALDDGEYGLRASHKSLVSEEWSYRVAVENGTTVERLEIWMQAGGVVSGRVYDAVTGDGIAGVEIGIDRSQSRGDTTGPDGDYRLSGLRGGEERIFLEHPKGYIDPPDFENGLEVTVAPGQELTGVDFALQPGVFAAITGTVVNEQGNPVPGVEVTATSHNHNTMRYLQKSEKAGADGTFAVDDLQVAGGFYIRAGTDGFVSEEIGPRALTAEGIHGLVLTLRPTGSIAGRVVDETTGGPVTDADLAVEMLYRSRGSNVAGGRGGDLDENGYFKLANLPPGSYGLYVANRNFRSTGYIVPQETVDVEYGQHVADVELTYNYQNYLKFKESLSRPRAEPDEPPEPIVGEIRGRVVRADTGEPVTSFRLRADHTWMGIRHHDSTVHDPDGRFTLEEEKGETVTIKISSNGFAPNEETLQGGFPPQPTQDITIRIQPGGVVEGAVTDFRGNPIAGAEIYVGVDPTVMPESHLDVRAAAVSQSDGSFRLDTLPASTTRIYANHPAHAVGWADVRASASSPTRVTIVLSAGGGIEGYVTRAGVPLAARYIGVLNEAGRNITLTNTNTDSEGHFRADNLSPGSYSVYTSVGEPAAWLQFREIEVAEGMITMVDLDFDDTPNTLEGKVTVDGAQPPSFGVRIEVRSGNRKDSIGAEETPTGEYVLANLPPGSGDLQVWARLADGSNISGTFPVTISGGAMQRDFDLRTDQ